MEGERESGKNSAGSPGEEILAERALARVRELEEAISKVKQTVEEKERYILKLQEEFDERSAWSLKLNTGLEATRERLGILQKEFEERTAWALSLEEARKRTEVQIQELEAQRSILDQRLNAITRSPLYRFLAFVGLVPK